MADLTHSRRDRGQLILLAAFIISVSFVVLALVVNSAIFTENLATRDDVAGSNDALVYRDELEESLASLLRKANRKNSTSISTTTVEQISRQGGVQQSTQGRVTGMEFTTQNIGVKIAQNTNRAFKDVGSSIDDWKVADNVDQLRDMRFNITSIKSDPENFELLINDSNDYWNLTIIEQPSSTVEIEVDPPNGSPESCTRTLDGYLRIDLTRGYAGGTPCPALQRKTDGTPMWPGAGVDNAFDIVYQQPDQVTGTYSLLIDKGLPLSNLLTQTANYGLVPADANPYFRNTVYSFTVSYSYYTAQVGYETDIRVAPGEVPP